MQLKLSEMCITFFCAVFRQNMFSMNIWVTTEKYAGINVSRCTYATKIIRHKLKLKRRENFSTNFSVSTFMKIRLLALELLRICTRWFKYDRDKLWLIYTQSVPVIFEPSCTKIDGQSLCKNANLRDVTAQHVHFIFDVLRPTALRHCALPTQPRAFSVKWLFTSVITDWWWKCDKVITGHTMKAYERSEGTARLFLSFAALSVGKSASCPYQFRPEKNLTLLNGRVEGNWALESIWRFWRREEFFSLPGVESQFLGCPACSLDTTDCVVRPPNEDGTGVRCNCNLYLPSHYLT